MSIKGRLTDRFKSSRIFNFNVVERDAWLANQAKQIPAGSHVLDAGAGSCPYREFFAHCDYRTQDFVSLKGEQLSGGKYGSIDYICDIVQIPVPDDTFDVIICTEVLEHLLHPEIAITEFARILKPQGKLLLSAPLGSGIHQEPHHYYGGFTPFWYKKVLHEAGFGETLIEANGGTLKAFGQESLRFILMTRPWKLDIPLSANVAWTPIWCVLSPLLGVAVPLACHYLDRFELEQRFTIGYHVVSVRNDETPSPG